VRRSHRPGFEERLVHPLFFLWPHPCRDRKVRFLGFHSRYNRPYVKPRFRLAKADAATESQ